MRALPLDLRRLGNGGAAMVRVSPPGHGHGRRRGGRAAGEGSLPPRPAILVASAGQHLPRPSGTRRRSYGRSHDLIVRVLFDAPTPPAARPRGRHRLVW
jgi:hypothetical protein